MLLRSKKDIKYNTVMAGKMFLFTKHKVRVKYTSRGNVRRNSPVQLAKKSFVVDRSGLCILRSGHNLKIDVD